MPFFFFFNLKFGRQKIERQAGKLPLGLLYRTNRPNGQMTRKIGHTDLPITDSVKLTVEKKKKKKKGLCRKLESRTSRRVQNF